MLSVLNPPRARHAIVVHTNLQFEWSSVFGWELEWQSCNHRKCASEWEQGWQGLHMNEVGQLQWQSQVSVLCSSVERLDTVMGLQLRLMTST